MKVTHSVGTDQAYIALKNIGPGESAYQHLVSDSHLAATVVLDVDAEGRLLGVDVLSASVGLPPEALEEAELIDTD
jgi:uncharacterized protein YuzE